MSKLIERLEEIAIVDIDLRSREIILYAKDGERLKWGTDVIKFAKSSPIGLIIQGLTKWCYGYVMDDTYINPDTTYGQSLSVVLRTQVIKSERNPA